MSTPSPMALGSFKYNLQPVEMTLGLFKRCVSDYASIQQCRVWWWCNHTSHASPVHQRACVVGGCVILLHLMLKPVFWGGFLNGEAGF